MKMTSTETDSLNQKSEGEQSLQGVQTVCPGTGGSRLHRAEKGTFEVQDSICRSVYPCCAHNSLKVINTDRHWHIDPTMGFWETNSCRSCYQCIINFSVKNFSFHLI